MGEDLLQHMRETDLRHGYGWALAEMIREMQLLVDSVAASQGNAKQLLSAALITSREGIERFREASTDLRTVADAAQQDIVVTLEDQLNKVIAQLGEKLSEIKDSGAQSLLLADRAFQAPAAKLALGIDQLVRASKEAEASRDAHSASRARLADYMKELDAYEALVIRRCQEAVDRAGAGLSVMQRLKNVFYPIKPRVSIPKPPGRPN